MPIIYPDAKTKTEILRTQPQGTINYRIDVGKIRRGRVIKELEKLYPNARKGEVEKVYEHVIESRVAGRELTKLEDNKKLPAGMMPINKALIMRYQYRVQMQWQDTSSGATKNYTVMVISDHNLTLEEIRKRAYMTAKSQIEARPVSRKEYPRKIRREDDVGFKVLTAEHKG